MTRFASPRLRTYATLSVVGLVAALAAGRPELAALATPFLLFVGIGLAEPAAVAVDGTVRLERDRVMEGQAVHAIVTVCNGGPAVRVDLHLRTPGRLHAETTPVAFWLARGERRDIPIDLAVERWGTHMVGPAVVRVRDRLGVFGHEGVLGRSQELRAYPSAERLHALVAPLRTRPFLGGHVSRERGEGIEFADLRPLVPGDRVRRINWRATSRRRVPYVNAQHPERSADVVLFLDTFAEAQQAGVGTLDDAVRAVASLASAYLARRDRVALLSFGGVLSWLTPTAGTRQLYRIVDALLASDVMLTYAWKDVTLLPRRLLPPRAIVLALSPLLDARAIGVLLDLRARGYDLTVIEVSPVELTPAGDSAADRLAYRLWRMQRDALRARFEALGVPVARWRAAEASLDPAIEGVTRYRRHARPALRA